MAFDVKIPKTTQFGGTMRYLMFMLIVLSSCQKKPIDEPFEPKPDPKPDVRPEPKVENVGLILIGDTGMGNKDQYRVADGMQFYCDANKCDAALMMGDNFYSDGVKSVNDAQFISKFEKPYKNLNFKFYPSLGNHDARQNKQAQVDYKSDKWDMPAMYYKKSFGQYVDVFALDTNDLASHKVYKQGKNQLAWLDKSLAESKAHWKIVYGHHPIFSYGAHKDSYYLKKFLLPILQKHEITFYASGHDHDLQLIKHSGIYQIVSGAGAKLRSTKAGKHTIYAKSKLGFAHLLLTSKKAVLKFVDKDAKILHESFYEKQN